MTRLRGILLGVGLCISVASVFFALDRLHIGSIATLQAAPNDDHKGKDFREHEPRRILLSGTLERDQFSTPFNIPKGKVLMVTDIFAYNSGPGSILVDPTMNSILRIGSFTGSPFDDVGDVQFRVLGNDPLNLHFTTGLQIVGSSSFRVLDCECSSSPLVHYIITGFYED